MAAITAAHSASFPKGAAKAWSIPAGAVIKTIQEATDRGQQEVILTGVDLTSYGPDLPGQPSLGSLVERILKHVPALPRLRLSSLDSVEIDPLLEDIIVSDPRVMPHVHLSLQSGDDMILKRMKRRHSRAQAVALVESQRPSARYRNRRRYHRRVSYRRRGNVREQPQAA